MRIKDFKIGTKLYLGFSLTIIIIVLFGLIAFSGFSNIMHQIKISNLTSDVVLEIGNAQAASLRYNIYLADEYHNLANEKIDIVTDNLKTIETMLKSEKNKKLIDDLILSISSYEQSNTDYFNLEKKKKELALISNSAATDVQDNIDLVIDVAKAYIQNNRDDISAIDRLYLLQEADNSMLTALLNMNRYLLSATITNKENLAKSLNNTINVLEKAMPLMASQETVKAIETALTSLEGYKSALNEYILLVNEQQTKQTEIKQFAGETLSTTSLLEEGINGFIANTRGTIFKLLITTLIFACLISVIIAIYTSRIITKPLTLGLNYAKTISEGDLTQDVRIDQMDEAGQLINALNAMNTKLREVIGTIIYSTDNIAAASQQISSTSQELSQGANEQASSVEEVSSTVEQITSNIEQNNENAHQTQQISLKAQTGIFDVNKHSEEAIKANKTIYEKINVINDIAFQTNILALNAAVEAARAGEHGKGFAVVAAEVRKLAENSKRAAEEIVELAQNGLSLTTESGEKLTLILPEIEKSTQLVQEITAASAEQTNGAQQINNAIQQLNSVTQQTAASSEELATSAEEMSSQADRLKDLIGFFKVEKSSSYKFDQNKIRNKRPVVNHKNKTMHRAPLDNTYKLDMDKDKESDIDYEEF